MILAHMILRSRHFAIAVLLGFLLSLAAIGAHAMTHNGADFVDCELCAGYGDQPGALCPSESDFLIAAGASSYIAGLEIATESAIPATPNARGPPSPAQI
jgi:hypothetical protein